MQSTDNLVGGSYNGLINFFDLRKPGATIGQAVPLETSVIEKSHHDPVYDVFWISSKTGAPPTQEEEDLTDVYIATQRRFVLEASNDYPPPPASPLSTLKSPSILLPSRKPS